MGAVLRNTSNGIAYRTRVNLKVFLIVNGVPQGPLQGSLLTMEIPVMLPGQRVGTGRPLIHVGGTSQVTSVDVDVQTTTWLPNGALGGFTPTTDTADDKRTELYSYCDLNVPQPDINDVF